jgi:hypothetical protein
MDKRKEFFARLLGSEQIVDERIGPVLTNKHDAEVNEKQQNQSLLPWVRDDQFLRVRNWTEKKRVLGHLVAFILSISFFRSSGI